MKKWIVVVLIGLLLLAGCNYPTAEEDSGAKETSVAQTVAAEVEDTTPVPVEKTKTVPTPTGTKEKEPEEGEQATETPEPTKDPEEEVELGEGDLAEFIADVTIPDYSEIAVGDDITKTWRVKNAGSTTWTTSYVLEFEKGEKLGASTQIPLAEEVAPGELVDISIDFRVPAATGEYSSYWILKNEENQRVGIGDEGNSLSLYMVILAVKEDEAGDGGDETAAAVGGVFPAGRRSPGRSVSVNDANYEGACPAELSVQLHCDDFQCRESTVQPGV